MQKNVIIIFVIAVAIIAGGVFVLYQYELADDVFSLFAKKDYKIKERDEGVYIIIDSIGFTAKAPDGWIAEIQEDDLPGVGVEYWVKVTSADLEGYPEIGEGCGFSIGVTIDEERNQKVKDEIEFVQKNPEKFNELGYDFKYASSGMISGKPALFWLSSDADFPMRQMNGVTVPLGGERLLSISSGTIPGYNEICLPIWQKFLMAIKIE